MAFFPVNIHHIIGGGFYNPGATVIEHPSGICERKKEREREYACIDLADALLHTYTTSRRFYDYIHFLSVLTGTHGKGGKGRGP